MGSNKKQVSLYDRAFLDSLPSLTISDYNDEIAEATRNAMFVPASKKNIKKVYRKTPGLNVNKKRNIKVAKLNEQSSKANKQNFQNGKKVFYIKYFRPEPKNLYEPNISKKFVNWQEKFEIRTEYKLQPVNSNQSSILKINPKSYNEGNEFLFIQRPIRPDHNHRYFIRTDLIKGKYEIKHRLIKD